jgi:hypothetical protein
VFRLVYWVVYGLFNTFESLSDFSLSWLPIYHPLKLLFLLWCFLPQYQGSQLVFDILVRPVLMRHEAAIEKGVETAQQGPSRMDERACGLTSRDLMADDVCRAFLCSAVVSSAAMFSVGRVGRVVRAKSIQLSKAIQSVVTRRTLLELVRTSRTLDLTRSLVVVACLRKTGEQLMSSSNGSSSSSSVSSVVCASASTIVRPRVAAIESMSSMGVSSNAALSGISEGHEGEHVVSDDGQSASFERAFNAASKFAAARQRE